MLKNQEYLFDGVDKVLSTYGSFSIENHNISFCTCGNVYLSNTKKCSNCGCEDFKQMYDSRFEVDEKENVTEDTDFSYKKEKSYKRLRTVPGSPYRSRKFELEEISKVVIEVNEEYKAGYGYNNNLPKISLEEFKTTKIYKSREQTFDQMFLTKVEDMVMWFKMERTFQKIDPIYISKNFIFFKDYFNEIKDGRFKKPTSLDDLLINCPIDKKMIVFYKNSRYNSSLLNSYTRDSDFQKAYKLLEPYMLKYLGAGYMNFGEVADLVQTYRDASRKSYYSSVVIPDDIFVEIMEKNIPILGVKSVKECVRFFNNNSSIDITKTSLRPKDWISLKNKTELAKRKSINKINIFFEEAELDALDAMEFFYSFKRKQREDKVEKLTAHKKSKEQK